MTQEMVQGVAQVLNEFADRQSVAVSQAGTCEAAFLENLMGLGQKLALQAAEEMANMVRDYLSCRFGVGPQAAQVQGLGDQITAILKDCALGNWRILLTGGWQGYAAAVAKCAVGKLLGGGIGGIIPGTGFVSTPVHRCG